MHAAADTAVAADAPPELLAAAVASAEHGSRVVLTREGKPVAFLVPVEDAEALERIEDAHDVEAVRLAMEEYVREGHTWPSCTAEELAARWGTDAEDSATP